MLVAVRVAKKAGVSVTIAARLQVVVTLVVSRAPMPHAVTNRLPTVASAVLPHVLTSPSHLAVTNLLRLVVISRLLTVAKNLSLLVAIGLLLHVVKSRTRHAVKNRLAIVATLHAVINLMPPAAKILTRMRALSHVRLSPALIVVLQIVRPTQVSLRVQHAILRPVAPHQAVKPSHHAVTVQHAQALLAPVRHVLQRVHAVVLPLTAVAVKL